MGGKLLLHLHCHQNDGGAFLFYTIASFKD